MLFLTQIWVLELFPNSSQWWHKREKSIPRCLAWSDGMKIQKADRESLFYSNIQLNKLEPTAKEMKKQWWKSSVEYFEKSSFENSSTQSPSSDKRGKKKKRKVVTTEIHVHTHVHTQTHVHTEIRSEVDGFGEASLGDKLVAMERDIGGRLAAIEQKLKIQKVSFI